MCSPQSVTAVDCIIATCTFTIYGRGSSAIPLVCLHPLVRHVLSVAFLSWQPTSRCCCCSRTRCSTSLECFQGPVPGYAVPSGPLLWLPGAGAPPWLCGGECVRVAVCGRSRGGAGWAGKAAADRVACARI